MAEGDGSGHTPPPDIPESFDYETRFVVLSFLGLVPSNVLDQSFSSSRTSWSGGGGGGGEGGREGRSSGRGDSSLSSLPNETLDGKVSRLGSTDDEEPSHGYGDEAEDTVDMWVPQQSDIKSTLNDHLIQQQGLEELDNLRPMYRSNGSERHKLQKHKSFDVKPENSLNKRHSEERRRLNKGHAMYMSPQRPNHIPVRSFLSVDGSGDVGERCNSTEKVSPKPTLFRRDSDFSEGSEVTVSVVSSRSTYVDVQSVDLEPLLKNNMINPNIVPLKQELKQEKKDLEESYLKVKGVSSESPLLHRRGLPGTPASDVSPEAEVAQYLCMLGDQVEERFSGMLHTAFESVMARPVGELTYEDLQAATQDLAGNTTGWTKIALMMVFGKRLTYNFLSTGGTGVHKLIDFTSRLVEDSAASFILQKGGWHAITELELNTPCTPSDVYMKFPFSPAPPPPDDIPECSTVTGTPAGDLTTTSSTLDDPTPDHEATEELPIDPEPRDQPDAGHVPKSGSDTKLASPYQSRSQYGSQSGYESGSPLRKTFAVDDDNGEDYDEVYDEDLVGPSIREEVESNISRIHTDILYLRQSSRDFSRHMEEERRRFEEEQLLWRRFGYMALGTIGAAIVVGLALWKRNGGVS